MTHADLVMVYAKKSAAHKYIYGFVHTGKLYYVVLSWTEMLKLLKNDKAAASKGGMLKIRVRAKAETIKELLASGRAIEIGGAEVLETNDKYNKGERFERVITELLTAEKWVKDSVPFWMAGDIQLNGEEVQIKLDGAELTNERTIAKLLAA